LRLLGLGKDLTLYKLLEAQAEAAHRAAIEFHKLSRDFANCEKYIDKIVDIEHEADELTHQLANKVDATFVTPLDKEDLRALSSGLDDITDFIESCASRLGLYELREPRPDLEPLAGLLVEVTRSTHELIATLRNMRGREAIQPLLIRIHDLENQSDQGFRAALATLFNAPNADPLMVMKWKEVYDRVEIAVDKCEDVATVVESVVVKYA
jgi:uncharacterized protein